MSVCVWHWLVVNSYRPTYAGPLCRCVSGIGWLVVNSYTDVESLCWRVSGIGWLSTTFPQGRCVGVCLALAGCEQL